MVNRPVNGVRLPVEARIDNLEVILPRVERFLQTQAEINLKHAERYAESKEHAERLARDVEALRMFAAGGWRTRLLAKRILMRLEAEGKAVAAPPVLAQEMATYADEDRRRVDFAALVTVASFGLFLLGVVALVAWWLLSGGAR